MDEVWSIVEAHHVALETAGELVAKRRSQQRAWLWSMIEEGLRAHFLARDDVQRMLPEIEDEVARGKVTPTAAARRLLALLELAGDGQTTASEVVDADRAAQMGSTERRSRSPS